MYSSNSVPMVGQDVKEGEISLELAGLISQCARLTEEIGALESRLEPVLARRPDPSEKVPTGPEAVRVPLADALHERVIELAGLGDRLQSIRNRVEL